MFEANKKGLPSNVIDTKVGPRGTPQKKPSENGLDMIQRHEMKINVQLFNE
jgi:hypothetical protein